MTAAEPLQRPRSTFISVLAWFGIIGGAFGTLVGLGILAFSPTLTALWILLGAVAGLICSLGLRQRRNWARLSFIGVQVYGILNVVVTAVRGPVPAGALRDAGVSAAQAREVMSMMRGAALAGYAVYVLINLLIIAKLCSRQIREEFGVADDVTV